MAFEWNTIYNCDEKIRKEITDTVIKHVCSHYKIENIQQLSSDQIKEIEAWRHDNLHALDIMQIGFENLIYYWEEKDE